MKMTFQEIRIIAIDDVLSINNSRFAEFLPLIYPPELEVKETTDQMKMTFQEIRIIATGPCIANQLRDVNTICRRSWYIVLSINNSRFAEFLPLIYPPELEVKETTDTASSAFQEIRIIATGPCIANQLRDANTICRRSWYITAHIWKIYDLKIYFTEFGAALRTVLPVLFKYCYKYCYSDSRKL
jgi:citrate lyase synthetase